MINVARASFAVSLGISGAAAALVGCSSSNTASPAGTVTVIGGGPDASIVPPDGSTLATGDDSGVDAGTSRVRFVHLAGELGGVDFCWRSSAADPFHGPILQTGSQATAYDGGAIHVTDAGAFANDDGAASADASVADASNDAADAAATTDDDSGSTDTMLVDAGPPPLTYLGVSNDLSIGATGSIDIIAVEPGSGCAASLVQSSVNLAPATRTTLILAGGAEADAAGALAVSAYGDELASADTSQASVRVINAALAPFVGPIALAFEAGGTSITIARDVQPRAPAPGTAPEVLPPTDSLGYALLVPPTTAPSFRILTMLDGGAFDTAPIAFAPSAGSVHTAFVTADATSFVVLWSDDLLSPSASPLR